MLKKIDKFNIIGKNNLKNSNIIFIIQKNIILN